MTLVDTSAWVEYFRATGSRHDQLLTEIIGVGEFACTDVVMAEIVMGAPSVRAAVELRRIASSGRFYPVRPLFDYETAAEIYRACRAAGATPRSLADCLVAAVAINNGLELLAADRDFESIAEHSPLRLA